MICRKCLVKLEEKHEVSYVMENDNTKLYTGTIFQCPICTDQIIIQERDPKEVNPNEIDLFRTLKIKDYNKMRRVF